ncbi:MAG: RHS repeat-associated core domain-containing protein, partial [Spirochaetaceae bacterium]|nr:RHS repeat-associated core domain-containing protein [Spirochaetaceae bacterium]
YDEFGRLTQEKNRLDGTQNYTYNENTEFSGKKDFEGNMTAVVYDTRTRTKKTSYADGTESIIVYDACGNIVSAANESGIVTYTYNKAGKLIKQTDTKTGTDINYTYDKAGRKSSLTSDKRKILYAYGKNGEIISVKDTVQNIAVSYGYDKCGRETERKFANGVVQKTRYDKAGRAVSIAQYAKNGYLLSGEAYVYDETGRRSHTVNDKGFVTIYKYDNQSRLETVYYPFNDDIKETARKEADKQGLYFLPSQGNPENYFLSTSEMVKLRAAAENLARARGNSITVNQVVWKESYTYDANGNRTSKTTAWGTIAYSYDKENRLVESGELGKSESVKYTYDKNGNLLKENSPRYRKEFEYNAQNRMSLSHVQDFVEDTRNIAEYDYDAFGRRVETYQFLGDYTRNLYDGFSFDIVGKSVLQSAYSANLTDQKYRTPNRQSATSVTGSRTSPSGRNNRGTDIGTRYRYIDDNPLVSMPEATASSSTSANSTTAKTRSRPNNEYVLYSYGEPVAMSADGNASYFGSDILGSVRSVTDKYGTVQVDYSYDVFGSPYLGNLENDIGFGYCGKTYDVGTGLYNYGFRDYSPVSARFTTVDPVRDGANWFAYVVNDPVNYVDLLGLKAQDKSYTLDAYEYQIRTNNSLLLKIVEELAQKGVDIIPYSKLLDDQGKSATERFADALTSAEGLAVLQDSTRAYILSLSRQELIDSLNKANLVTGMDKNEINKAVVKLKTIGIDISFDPTDGNAFSICGYAFTDAKTDDIVLKKDIGNETYYVFNNEDTMRLYYHEDVHYQSALAKGNSYQWLMNYNNEYEKNLASGMTKKDAYNSLSDEREAYSFGPEYSNAETNIRNPITGEYEYIRW